MNRQNINAKDNFLGSSGWAWAVTELVSGMAYQLDISQSNKY